MKIRPSSSELSWLRNGADSAVWKNLVIALASAPFSTNNLTASKSPMYAAQWRGVKP